MGRRTLIRGGTCVFHDEVVRANVVVEDNRLASIDAPKHSRADRIVEAGGLYLLPGIVDSHVHFRDPGLTNKEDVHTGSLAAAKSGVTTILDMPNTIPPTITCDRLYEKLDHASRACHVNYGFYIGATTDNLTELQAANRTPGIKIFIGSSTGNMLVDDQETLENIFAHTMLPICAHCEDESTVRANAQLLAGGHRYEDHSAIRDSQAAFIAARRATDLARRHSHRFHLLHTSTQEECELLTDHCDFITAEACPHHLLMDTSSYDQLGALAQVNPALKSSDDCRALWNALKTGALQSIVTDHAPHTLKEKTQPYPESPSGLPSIENALALMLNEVNRGNCTLSDLAMWMSDAPARIWDMVGKGRIVEGYDADLVLVDLEKSQTICNQDQVTKCKWSPWDGMTLTGWPVTTFVQGHIVYDNGTFDESILGLEVPFDHARGGYWATA